VWRFGNPRGGASDCMDYVDISRIVCMLKVVEGSVVSSGRRENTYTPPTSLHGNVNTKS
jgi:hypothetical protein